MHVKFFQIIAMMLSIIVMPSCMQSCKPPPQKRTLITVALGLPVETVDPRYATSAVAARVSKLIYAPLFELDEDLSPEPFLAQSITALDEKTFKVTLREGLTFHDGSPLTADDVVYTFGELGSKDVLSPHAEKLNYIKDIRKQSALEIIFELKRPFAPFLTDICALGVVSKKSCEHRSQQCRHEYNGSGPFVMNKWDTAKESLELLPFAHWFEGAPKNGLLLRVVRDENTRLLELMGKKTDIVEGGDISPQNTVELKKQPFLKVETVKGLGYSYLAINVRGPKTTDKPGSPQYITRSALAHKKVRSAIAHAIDFDSIIEKILLGTADRASGLLPHGHWAKDETLKPPHYDAKLAEQELDSAGFLRVGPKGNRFHITIATTPNRMRQSIVQLYADYLGKVGIDVTIRVKEWGSLYQDMKQGNFELFSAIWVPVTEPDLYYWVHHSASIPKEDGNGGNRHGFSDPVIDSLIEKGRASIIPEERKGIYQEIERRMLDLLPYIPLWNERRIVVVNTERIQDFTPSITGSLLSLRKAQLRSPSDRPGS